MIRTGFGLTSFGVRTNRAVARSQGPPAAMFPGAVATNTQLAIGVDRLQTILASQLSPTANQMTVIDGTGIVPDCLMTIDDEIVQTGIGTGNIWPITRGHDGTAPAIHLSGATVSGFINAWHHNALVSEIQAIERTLGPNLSKIPTTAAITTGSYVFAPQTPGGTLAPGANVVALDPVPPGLAVGNYLRVFGGTGAAEAVQITGVSPTSVIVTCANAHSGAWSIATATGGVQEAMVAAANMGTLATVIVSVPAQFYAVANVPLLGADRSITLRGQGRSTFSILRDTGYRNGPLLSYNAVNSTNQVGFEVHDMLIMDGAPDHTWLPSAGSSAIYIKNAIAGKRIISNVAITNPYVGVRIEGSFAVELSGVMISWGPNSTGSPLYGIQILGINTITGGPGSVISLSDVQILGSVGSINYAAAGIQISCADGCQIINSSIIQTDFGVLFNSTAVTDQIDDVFFDSCLLDGNRRCNFGFTGGGPAYVGDISIRNCYMTMWPSSATPPTTLESGILVDASSKIQSLEITNNIITTSGHSGIELIGPNLKKMIIGGNRITDCNALALGYSGIVVRAGVSNVLIQGNTIGNTGMFSGSQPFGITIEGTGGSTNLTIVGNDLHGNQVGAVELLNVPSNLMVAANGALDDVIPVIASGASIPAPANPTFKVSGTTTITTITGGWAGARKTLLKTDAGSVTVGGGGNVPGTHTLAQNQSITLTFDGTVWS